MAIGNRLLEVSNPDCYTYRRKNTGRTENLVFSLGLLKCVIIILELHFSFFSITRWCRFPPTSWIGSIKHFPKAPQQLPEVSSQLSLLRQLSLRTVISCWLLSDWKTFKKHNRYIQGWILLWDLRDYLVDNLERFRQSSPGNTV